MRAFFCNHSRLSDDAQCVHLELTQMLERQMGVVPILAKQHELQPINIPIMGHNNLPNVAASPANTLLAGQALAAGLLRGQWDVFGGKSQQE